MDSERQVMVRHGQKRRVPGQNALGNIMKKYVGFGRSKLTPRRKYR